MLWIFYFQFCQWGLKNFPNPKLTWVGFDTFTGLPNDWTRNGNVYLAQGSFSTQGVAPRISDSRLSFVIGDVTTTCRKIPELLRNRTDGKVLFIFDLDNEGEKLIFNLITLFRTLIILVWTTMGTCIFWGLMDNTKCEKSIYYYMIVSIIIRYIFGLLFLGITVDI